MKLYLKIQSSDAKYPVKDNLKQLVEVRKMQLGIDKANAIIKDAGFETMDESNKHLIDIKAIKKEINAKTKEITEEVKESHKYFPMQLRSLDNFPAINTFVALNSPDINEYGKIILVPDFELKTLLKESNLADSTSLSIYYDSNNVLCKLMAYNVEQLEQALLDGIIDGDKYKLLVEVYNNKQAHDKDSQEPSVH